MKRKKDNTRKKKRFSQYELCREVLKVDSLDRAKRIISNIFSNSFLTYIVLKSTNSEVRKMAFDKIDNQRFYWLILKHVESKKQKNTIVSKITDKNVLAEIVVFEPDINVAITALYILGETKMITLLACYGSELARIEAINYVDSKEELMKIAQFEGQYESVKKYAEEKLRIDY